MADPNAPSFVVKGGSDDGATLTLEKGRTFVIGSGHLADLRLSGDDIASAHARATWDDNGVSLVSGDAGTWVNGEAVQTVQLWDGDRIAFARPGTKTGMPKLVVNIPISMPSGDLELTLEEEAVPSLAPPPPPPPPAPAPRAVAHAPAPTLFDEPTVEPEPAGDAFTLDDADVGGPILDEPPATVLTPLPRLDTPAPPPPPPPPPPLPTSPAPIAYKEPPAPPPPPPPPPPRPAAPRVVAKAPVQAEKKPAGNPLASLPPKLLAGVAAGVVLVLVLAGLGLRALFPAGPRISALTPSKAVPGQAVTISGSGFDPDPARNVVKFGHLPAQVTAVSSAGLSVKVPEFPTSASIQVVVQTRRGRSEPVPFQVAVPPRAGTIDPDVAMPGDEVTLHGDAFEAPLEVAVGGIRAEVLETRPDAIRFRVPPLEIPLGGTAMVVVKAGGEPGKGVDLIIGRLPLLQALEPRQVAPGGVLTLTGKGFAPAADDNSARLGGQPAAVVAASPTQLKVQVAVDAAEGPGEIKVETAGRGSSLPLPVTVVTPGASAFQLRFGVRPGPAGSGQALVVTQLGPLLLLGGRDSAGSATERGFAAASALLAAAEALRTGQSAAQVEVRESPDVGIGIAGRPGLLLRVTSEDLAAYEAPPGVTGKQRRPTAHGLASHWTACIDDLLTLLVQGQRPTRLLASSPRGKAMAELGFELGWKPGNSVPTRVTLSPELRDRLAMLFLLPPDEGQGSGGAALEGRWQGTIDEEGVPTRPASIEFRVAGKGGLSGTLATRSGSIALSLPLREISVKQGKVRFSVALGGTDRVFEAPLAGETLTGTLSVKGAARGTFTLKFQP